MEDSQLKTTAWLDRMGASLLFVPSLFIVAAALLGFATLAIDSAWVGTHADLPLGFTSTVPSARAVLSTIASATMTVAGIAFSVALLLFQQASSQYSPRIIHGLFRDQFNKRVMGIVLGTFTYCLVVLRAVHQPLEGDSAVVPTLSVAVAVVLGIISVLAIVAFINHSAHMMDVSQLLQAVADDTKEQTSRTWQDPDEADGGDHLDVEIDLDLDEIVLAEQRGLRVQFEDEGWIQQIDHNALLSLVEPGGTVRLETTVGRYAISGTALCTIWSPAANEKDTVMRARDTVQLGRTRTLTQDVAYGLRQAVDVALKALSPGINDPTTAQDAIFHAAAMLREMLMRQPPPRLRVDDDGRRLVAREAITHRELIDLTFDEVRQAAGPYPTVCVYLLEAISLVTSSLTGSGAAAARGELLRQARAIVDESDHAGALPADAERVRRSYEHRFGQLERQPSG